MKHGLITIHFQHYWHCGSGQAGEGDVDLLPVVEPCGLPYVPGRALRGRLKWAGRELGWDEDRLNGLFGKRDAELDDTGKLQVANATMGDAFADGCRSDFAKDGKVKPEVSALFEDIASTALQAGAARDKSLRRVRYAVPVTVMAEVALEDDSQWSSLDELVHRLRAIGKGKHDGFGWCQASLEDAPDPARPAMPGDALAYDLEIELLDDVVFSATSATTGGHRTLDHVPGSALMGAFARRLFSAKDEKVGAGALIGAKVSFGNAVPVGADGKATLPVPLSWHHRKGDSWIKDGAVQKDAVSNLAAVEYGGSALNGKQPVQVREGWLDTSAGRIVTVHRTQTLKTAIEEDPGKYETAKEKALFGYEAIEKGARFIARIELKDQSLLGAVCETFDGSIIRLGRSKGTEFGRVRCTLKTADGAHGGAGANDTLVLLAESDIMLLDGNGFPKLEPSAEDCGLGGWELRRSRSYLRFRRYSPWNAKRGGPDIERQVISKGSVFVFTNENGATATPKLRVGLGQTEGLGRVRIAEWMQLEKHPGFTKSDHLQPSAPGNAPSQQPLDTNDITPWVKDRHEEKGFDTRANALAQKWAANWSRAKGKVSASQWGRLDDAARDVDSVKTLLEALGNGNDDEPGKKTITGHGRLQKKWKEGNLVGAIRKSLEDTEHGDRLRLAAFRSACHRMAAKTRRERD